VHFSGTLLTDTLRYAPKYTVCFLCFGIVVCLVDSLPDEGGNMFLRNVSKFLSQTTRCHTSDSSNRTKFFRRVSFQWTISNRIESHLVSCRRQMWPPSHVLTYSCLFMAHKFVTSQEVIHVICFHITDKYNDIFTILTRNFSKEQYLLPEDDLKIETCRSILSVLM